MTDPSSLVLAAFLGGHWEVLIILLIILILFGSRLPGIARSLGQGINEFKKGLSDRSDEKPSESTKPTSAKEEHKV